jgi:benzoyl-CoA reductase subunit D
MVTAGIDVGFENTKAVILKDGKIAGKAIGRTGWGNRAKSVESVWNEALRAAGVGASDVNKIVATGEGKRDVNFAQDWVVEPVADAKAARNWFPNATSVVDIGADQARVVTLGEGDAITEVVLNQKCAAGLGTFLRDFARKLELSLDELGKLSAAAPDGAAVNDGCRVFAELDALSLLNQGVAKEDVARAVMNAVVVRMNSVLDDKTRPSRETTVFIGGLTKNAAVVDGLINRSGIRFLIPEEAEYGGALGAALYAAV